MKSVKKVFNVEYDLSSADFIAQKMDTISQEFQDRNPNDIVKVTTFCVPDKQLVISTTDDNVAFMGAANKMLASRAMSDETFLTMDDDMIRTYEITITAMTDLPDYVTALDVAQAKADEMFEKDDSKMPLVTVIDYRWGNPKTVVGASIFSDVDEDGNKISLIGATDSAANVVVGDADLGDRYQAQSGELIIDGTQVFKSTIKPNDVSELSFEIKDFQKDDKVAIMGVVLDDDPYNRFYLSYVADEDKFGIGLGNNSWVDNDMLALDDITTNEYQTIRMVIDDNKHIIVYLNDNIVFEDDIDGQFADGYLYFGGMNTIGHEDPDYICRCTIQNVKYILKD